MGGPIRRSYSENAPNFPVNHLGKFFSRPELHREVCIETARRMPIRSLTVLRIQHLPRITADSDHRQSPLRSRVWLRGCYQKVEVATFVGLQNTGQEELGIAARRIPIGVGPRL